MLHRAGSVAMQAAAVVRALDPNWERRVPLVQPDGVVGIALNAHQENKIRMQAKVCLLTLRLRRDARVT